MQIERSPGLATGLGFIVGGGFSGSTDELDQTVTIAAETLSEAYGGYPVVIRFNSDRKSGGAWLKTDDPDGIWLNAEVGICAHLTTQETYDRMRAEYPDLELSEPGIHIYAHVGSRVGERAHVKVSGIADALEYVQTHADLSRLNQEDA